MFDDVRINIAGGLEFPLPQMARVRQVFEDCVKRLRKGEREQVLLADLGKVHESVRAQLLHGHDAINL